ncbi:MAG: beta-propeller fold lactonase family protein [candidate division KSB1 bacterium]|nr:beta-propeller fold lactonase family protein [candidate division KSB1 bacterium]
MNNHFRKMATALLLVGLPGYAACATSGTLIVLNKTDNTATLIDLTNNTVRATLPTGVGPHEVAVSPDGRIAVVTNYGGREPGSSLTVIDVEKAVKIKAIELGDYRRPHGIIWYGTGDEILVTAEANKALLVVDIAKGIVRQAIPTDQEVSHMVALRPQQDRAFVANIRSGTATVIDLKQGEALRSIVTGDGAEGIDISPDGKEVWVSNRAANTVSIIDAEKLEVVAELKSADFPIRVKFTPDGKHVLVSHARSGEVAVFAAKSRMEVRRISMELTAIDEKETRLFGDRFGKSPVPIGICIPPHGKSAYIANSNADIVAVIDLSKWEIIERLPTGKEPDGLGWSLLR